MAASSASNRTEEPEKTLAQDQEEQEHVRRVGWKALFIFTTRKHIPVLVTAIIGAAIGALTISASAILFGLIFGQFSAFGAGATSPAVFLRNVSRLCIYLTGLGGLNWLGNSIYFMTFLSFGELQARSARRRIFNALLQKNMAWYDTRGTGTAAFLSAMQM